MSSSSSEVPYVDPVLRRRAARDFVLYGLARLGLFVVLTAIIQGTALLIDAPVPLAISSLLALLVAFPLSMFVFRGLRLRVTEELALWGEQRRAHKQWVEQELSKR